MDVHFSSADLQNAPHKLLLDMDDCANRDVWWYCEWWCLQDLYIYISVVLPAGSSQGKLEKKVDSKLTWSFQVSNRSFTPVRWMHSLQNCFWFTKKNLLRMRFFASKKLQIQFFHHFHPFFLLLLGSAIFLVVFGVVVCSKGVSFFSPPC